MNSGVVSRVPLRRATRAAATQGGFLRGSVVDEGCDGCEGGRGGGGDARSTAVEKEDGGLVACEREGDEVVLEVDGGADEALAGAKTSIGQRDGNLRASRWP